MWARMTDVRYIGRMRVWGLAGDLGCRPPVAPGSPTLAALAHMALIWPDSAFVNKRETM